jgi:hypothetical protein
MLNVGNRSNVVYQFFTLQHLIDLYIDIELLYDWNKNDVTAWEVLIGFVIWAIDYVI